MSYILLLYLYLILVLIVTVFRDDPIGPETNEDMSTDESEDEVFKKFIK